MGKCDLLLFHLISLHLPSLYKLAARSISTLFSPLAPSQTLPLVMEVSSLACH